MGLCTALRKCVSDDTVTYLSIRSDPTRKDIDIWKIIRRAKSE